MHVFIGYLKRYFLEIRIGRFLITSLFVALLIFLNYRFGIEKYIRTVRPWGFGLVLFTLLYLFIFSTGFLLQRDKNPDRPEKKSGKILIVVAALLFALKIIPWDIHLLFPGGPEDPWNNYFSIVLQLPLKLLMLLLGLSLIRKTVYPGEPFFGLSLKGFDPAPYLTMLLFVIPLIALASTQTDFLHTYPKVKTISFISDYARHGWFYQLVYEISYGLDFVSIELFFRGFLVIGFARFAGIHAILPMAVFYCSIHFGKPLAECISSYFGGILLGVIAYRTRSILGGLMVHLGLAWMMEIGGSLGHIYFNSR